MARARKERPPTASEQLEALLGYRIVAAEQRGSKIKKKLEIDPLHADTVRLIYRLFLEGDGTSGPMGVKAITCYLNERRIFTRDGGRWGLASIHRILTRTTYTGVTDLDAPGLKERIAGLKAIREQASADAERAQAALDHAGNQAVSSDMVKTFALAARQRIRLDSGGYRRDHLPALAQRVEVADKEVRIMGSKSELLRTLVAASGGKPGAAGVQSSVLKRRALVDSNHRPTA
jgi:hypothetical protein